MSFFYIISTRNAREIIGKISRIAKYQEKFLFLSLREKCPYSELFWCAFSCIFIRITSNMDTFHALCAVHTMSMIKIFSNVLVILLVCFRPILPFISALFGKLQHPMSPSYRNQCTAKCFKIA